MTFRKLRLPIFISACFLLRIGETVAQVMVVSPLPFGILQVHGNHADLRLHATLPAGYTGFRYKLSSDIDTVDVLSWHTPISVEGTIDTLITVPRSLRAYTLYWRATSYGVDTGGTIGNLTPGHIIGIAGQSNAEGHCLEMDTPAMGDIRMLTGDQVWEHAKEPTDHISGGPWIVMANMLFHQIGDTLPIGIVNVAVGGSRIGGWNRNDDQPEDSSLYGKAIKRWKNAGSELECLCWIQGESDWYYMPDPMTYRAEFDGLLHNFFLDLADSFPVFHLQVSGETADGDPTKDIPKVREAQRAMPPSILVGTALGRSLQADGLHFDVPTLHSAGRMFAGAILRELYGIHSTMYPPLMPDTMVTMDSISDAGRIGHHCLSLKWTRGGVPAKLRAVRGTQYFAVERDGSPFDTSEVWYRIVGPDSTRIQVGLRSDSVTTGHAWSVTYDPIADGTRAPLATIDPTSGDTIFATACYELPFGVPAGPMKGVKQFNVIGLQPNPSWDALDCYVVVLSHESLQIELRDNRGGLLRTTSADLDEGLRDIPINTSGLASGSYWIVLSDAAGSSVEKAVVIR